MGFKKNFEKRKGKNLIVLDIGTEFLKALFLEVDRQEEKGILRNWVKEPFTDLENIYPVCQKVIDKLEKKTGIKAEQLFLGIGGEIVNGTSTTICYKRENPQEKIDLPELKYLVQKNQWKAFDKIRKHFVLEAEFSEAEVKLVNAHIIDIKIDGNSLTNPLGFQGKTLCLSIFNTYTSAGWLDNLVKLASQLELELLGINSLSYALFHCLDLGGLNESVLIIDIGGKITELTLVKNRGEVVETRSFNLGGEIFTKTLSDFLELGKQEAERVKIKYSKGEISSEAKKKIDKLFSSNISSWSAGVRVVLDEFLKKYKALPSKIFLCGGGSSLPGIEQVLKREGNFKIKSILPREIVKIENKTKLQDIPCLALANLALDTFETTEFSSTLKRAVRLVQD